jgi:hypothetical protein
VTQRRYQQEGFLLFFLSFRNAQSGDFPPGKPRDLRDLRARRRGALPKLRELRDL